MASLRDKGDGRAFVQQRDGSFNLGGGGGEFSGEELGDVHGNLLINDNDWVGSFRLPKKGAIINGERQPESGFLGFQAA